jgi:hypothetical protein
VQSAFVSRDLFTALAVAPMAGRTFDQAEDLPNGPRVAVLSYELWQSAFGGAAVLGTAVDINSVRRIVVGIMPPGFDVADQRVQLWLPLGLDPANRQNRGSHFLYLIGRLAPGSTLASARGELETILAGWPASVGAGPGTTGVVGGLAIAFAMNRALVSLLFGVTPSDPTTIVGVVALIGVVTVVACYAPAYSATRVDPMIVLREE